MTGREAGIRSWPGKQAGTLSGMQRMQPAADPRDGLGAAMLLANPEPRIPNPESRLPA